MAVSASVGGAFYPQDGLTPEELLSEADRAMYESKDIHYRKRGRLSRLPLVDSLNE
jgi:GGDEF domain-containing protein